MGEDMPKLFQYASVQECAEKASELILNKIKNENTDTEVMGNIFEKNV